MKIRYKFHGAWWEISSKWEDCYIRKMGGKKRFVNMILNDLKEDSVFIDVGAANGLTTILAAKRSCAAVIAFEPDRSRFDKLIRNVELNKLNLKVKCFNVPLYFKSENNSSPYKVESKTLDSYFYNYNYSILKPTHIKIDVEGREVNVLEGARETLKKYRPILYIELHPSKCNPSIFFTLLKDLSYIIEDMYGRGNEIHIKAMPL